VALLASPRPPAAFCLGQTALAQLAPHGRDKQRQRIIGSLLSGESLGLQDTSKTINYFFSLCLVLVLGYQALVPQFFEVSQAVAGGSWLRL
jgi:hypothetical protein